MRHKRQTAKLGRSSAHRRATLASLVCGLIEQQRIRTTLSKAKAVQPVAERMISLARRGTLASRRMAAAYLRRKDCVSKLFGTLGPLYADRRGGCTRIVKVGQRRGDGAETAFLEFVNLAPVDRKKKAKTDASTSEQPPKSP